MSGKVIIGGGSGLIGKVLTDKLLSKGYEVSWLSRSAGYAKVPLVQWDPLNQKMPVDQIRKFDYFINLAGAGIANERWTDSRKKLITKSRVAPNILFAEAMKEDKGQLKSYLSSSAIGIYGDSGDEWMFEEQSINADGFLHQSCADWEDAIKEVAATGLRTVWLRTGIVLSTEGGALQKMLLPLKAGVSGYFGSGEQYYSWIHIEDMANMFIHALEHSWEGPYNAVAPAPVKMRTFAKILAKVSDGKQLVLPVPAFGIRLAMGEMSSVLLNSNRVSVRKAQEEGYSFTYTELQAALDDLLNS